MGLCHGQISIETATYSYNASLFLYREMPYHNTTLLHHHNLFPILICIWTSYPFTPLNLISRPTSSFLFWRESWPDKMSKYNTARDPLKAQDLNLHNLHVVWYSKHNYCSSSSSIQEYEPLSRWWHCCMSCAFLGVPHTDQCLVCLEQILQIFFFL